MSQFSSSQTPSNTLSFGINSRAVDLTGRTVGWVRRNIGGLVSLDTGSSPSSIPAKVNGLTVNEDTVIAAGQTVEFVYPSADKGLVA